ncbi:MAG: TonB family protein [Pseudomonadota bacterium]
MKWAISLAIAAAVHLGLLGLLRPGAVEPQIKGSGITVAFGSGEAAGQSGSAAPSAPLGDPPPDTRDSASDPEPLDPAPAQDGAGEAGRPPEDAPPPPIEPTEPEPEPEPVREPEPEPEPAPPPEAPQPEPVPEPAPEPAQETAPPVQEPAPTPAIDAGASEAQPTGPTAPAPGQDLAAATSGDITTPGTPGGTSAPSAASASAGNAASANYAGEVMEYLSRIRMPRAERSGSALVYFEIDRQGRLEVLSVSRSSGSNRFDRQVLRLIQRAEPFPIPPPGVNRSFTIEIEGR